MTRITGKHRSAEKRTLDLGDEMKIPCKSA